jgi:hypothetical protein
MMGRQSCEIVSKSRKPKLAAGLGYRLTDVDVAELIEAVRPRNARVYL